MKSYPMDNCICRIVYTLAVVLIAHTATAQEINKEVFVVKPYEPTLSDASKISSMPVPGDIEITTPVFTYKISPAPVSTLFEITPIKPAKLVSSALPKIYNTFLKIGFGNYNTPLAQFNISNLHSKEHAFGASLYHKSSHSNIILENEDKVPGGYSTSSANLYAKKFFNGFTLSGSVTAEHEGFNHYGYNTSLFHEDSLPSFDRSDIHQSVILLGGQAGVQSNHTDSLHLNYGASVRYNYLTDKADNSENILMINASFSKLVQTFMGGIDLSLNYFKPDIVMDSIGNTRFAFSPYISKRSEDWKFRVGFEGVIDQHDVSRFYIYPKGLLEFTVIEKIIIPFIGVGGKLESNHYQKILWENHFITPGLRVKNTHHKITAFAGIKGSITPDIAFRADASFTATENMVFYVNDTTTDLENTFTIRYDDIELIQYHGALAVEPSSRWHVTADFNYYSYKMFREAKPWHKPQFDLILNADYNLKEKLLIKGGMIIYGSRYAMLSRAVAPEGYSKLHPVADFNLGVEYLFSKVFTVFLDIYNITGRSYMLWNQYPSQRFNFLFGFTYKL